MTPPDTDVDSPDFVAEAERSRLGGDAHAAVRIAEAGLAIAPASAGGRMALALALIDLGDVMRAREELVRGVEQSDGIISHVAPRVGSGLVEPSAAHELEDSLEDPDGLADHELETAFAEAESNPDEMMSANRVVEQTLAGPAFEALDTDFDVANHPTYATETMASLLADQGRAAEAGAVRESLSTHESREADRGEAATPERSEASAMFEAAVGPEHARRLQIVATLERWLHNVRRHAELRNAQRNAGQRAGAGHAGTAGGAA